jgi:hypothetical protein
MPLAKFHRVARYPAEIPCRIKTLGSSAPIVSKDELPYRKQKGGMKVVRRKPYSYTELLSSRGAIRCALPKLRVMHAGRRVSLFC